MAAALQAAEGSLNGLSGTLETLAAALRPHGLLLRGVLPFSGGEGPTLRDGRSAGTIVLIGNAGSSYWQAFCSWRQGQTDRGGPDPLDHWSKAVIAPLADALGATAYFPSDPPYQPFQQWAMRAEGLRPSPLGLLIHPTYGLWHSFRGALGFGTQLEELPSRAAAHPCDHCREKPCLHTCPAEAIRDDGMDLPACRRHLATAEGRAGCMASGCVARNACPVGTQWRYNDEQVQFHMGALGALKA